ncbi:hypothetical protein ACVWYN_001200 [Pedobacter sp. UYP24]
MVKFKLLLFLVIILAANAAYPCVCATGTIKSNFTRSQFVATAKILKLTPDPINKNFHDAEIEVINLYKGERLTKIKILSLMNTSCRFLSTENSIWNIFATSRKGVLSFGSCSGSWEFDNEIDTIQNSKGAKNYAKSMALDQESIEVVKFLSSYQISNYNPSFLNVYNDELNSIKGYKSTTTIAIFNVTINPDLSIAKVESIKKFKNTALNKVVIKSMKKNLKVKTPEGKPDNKLKRLLVFCYYYLSQSTKEGSLGLMNL